MSDRKSFLNKVLLQFILMWVLTAVGVFIGTLVNPSLAIPIMWVTLILLIVSAFVRLPKPIIRFLTYIIPILVGITFNISIPYYLTKIDMTMLIGILMATIVLFVLLALIGMKTKKDLNGWGKYLFIAILLLIVMYIINMIFPFGSIGIMVLSFFGIIIFAGYNIYDFNQIAKNKFSEDDAPEVALGLYLNFVNLFKFIVEFILAFMK